MRARQQVLDISSLFFSYSGASVHQTKTILDTATEGVTRPRALARYTPLIASGAILLARVPTPRTETLRMGADPTPSDATTVGNARR